MKDDERKFLLEIANRGEHEGHESVRDVGKRLGIHPKRVVYLCLKWTDRRWYDYGVSADMGWLTEAGVAVATTLDTTGLERSTNNL